MRAACHAPGARKRLIKLMDLKSPAARRRRGGRRSCRRRQVLPTRLLRLNHNRPKLAGSHAKGLAMRIYGPNGTTLGTPAASARRSGTSAFALPNTVALPETRAATAPKAAGNI